MGKYFDFFDKSVTKVVIISDVLAYVLYSNIWIGRRGWREGREDGRKRREGLYRL